MGLALFFFANLGLARSGFKRRLWLSKICSGTKRIVRRPLSVDVGRTRGFFKQCELGDSIRKKDVGTIQVRIWVSIRPETHWKWDIIVLNQSISWWWEQNRSRWIPIPLDCRLEFPATNSKWGQCEKKSPDPILRLASYRSPSRHLQNTQLPPPWKKKLNSPHGGMIDLDMNERHLTLPQSKRLCLPMLLAPSSHAVEGIYFFVSKCLSGLQCTCKIGLESCRFRRPGKDDTALSD